MCGTGNAARVPGHAVPGLIRGRIKRQRQLFAPAPPSSSTTFTQIESSRSGRADASAASPPTSAVHGLNFWLDGHHPSGSVQVMLTRRLSIALKESGI